VSRTLNTEQIFEEARRLGKTVYRVASLPELGVRSPAEFFERLTSLRDRALGAFDKQCYIEYLSLMLLHIEVWLRIYLAGSGRYAGMNIYDDRLFFGQLIRRCGDAGMDQSVLAELSFVNDWRVDYVHSYLRKSFDYSTLIPHKARIGKIPSDLMNYVARTTGKKVLTSDGIGTTGDIVFVL
jgi:hypothetical protein